MIQGKLICSCCLEYYNDVLAKAIYRIEDGVVIGNICPYCFKKYGKHLKHRFGMVNWYE